MYFFPDLREKPVKALRNRANYWGYDLVTTFNPNTFIIVEKEVCIRKPPPDFLTLEEVGEFLDSLSLR